MEPVKAKPTKSVDRVILGVNEGETVKRWTDTLNERAEDLIRFTKSDVVNFLIRSHAAKLFEEEQQDISGACYEETRWLGWAMMKLRAAKKRNEDTSLDDLMKFRDGLLGHGSRKTRRKNENTVEPGSSEASSPSS